MEVQQDHFQELAVELQFRILSYVPKEDLVLRCSLVSKYWLALTRDPFLLSKRLSLNINSEAQRKACGLFLDTCPELVQLKLSSKISLQRILQSFKVFHGLKELELVECIYLNNRSFQVIVASCPTIERLTIDSCDSVDDNCFKHIVTLTKLKSLHLRKCDRVKSKPMELLALGACSLDSFHLIKMYRIELKDILQFIEKCGSNLHDLVLLSSSYQLRELIIALGNCPYIETLDISVYNCFVSDDEIEQLTSLARRLRSLSLDMHFKFTDLRSVVLFFQGIPSLEKLKVYDDVQYLDDNMLQVLVQYWQNLTSLSLRQWQNRTPISDIGILYILQECKNLLHLELENLRNVKGTFLDDIPVMLPNLRTLTIIKCDIQVSFSNRNLAKRMPHLKIVF